jgi:hypothetical protein
MCVKNDQFELCMKNIWANYTVAQTCLEFAIIDMRFRTIVQNRAKTTWPLLADGEYYKFVEMEEWSNVCTKR